MSYLHEKIMQDGINSEMEVKMGMLARNITRWICPWREDICQGYRGYLSWGIMNICWATKWTFVVGHNEHLLGYEVDICRGE